MKDWAWNLKDALNRDATSEYLCILKCRVGDVNTIVRNFDQSILYYALDAGKLYKCHFYRCLFTSGLIPL